MCTLSDFTCIYFVVCIQLSDYELSDCQTVWPMIVWTSFCVMGFAIYTRALLMQRQIGNDHCANLLSTVRLNLTWWRRWWVSTPVSVHRLVNPFSLFCFSSSLICLSRHCRLAWRCRYAGFANLNRTYHGVEPLYDHVLFLITIAGIVIRMLYPSTA